MNPFASKTVAAAVAPLLKVLKNLEAVVNAAAETIKVNHEAIDRLQSENRDADNERVNASQIIEALGSIVNYGPKKD